MRATYIHRLDMLARLVFACVVMVIVGCTSPTPSAEPAPTATAPTALATPEPETPPDPQCEACLEEGDTHYAAENFPAALDQYAQACETGVAEGCFRAGAIHNNGAAMSGIAEDYEQGAELLDRACGNGIADACALLATNYDFGLGVPQDDGRATELRLRACEDGSLPINCSVAGAAYLAGRGVGEDPARARELFGRACSEGDPRGCYELARLNAAGEGGAQNTERAAELFRQACDAGHRTACASLAGGAE